MTSHSTITTARTCPICDGQPRGLAFPYETVWNGKRYEYRGCHACGTTFVDPLPDPAELEAIYAWDSYHAKHYAQVDASRHARALASLKRFRGERSTLLDFGCGNGSFLRAASSLGLRCEGVEYEPKAIAKAQEQAGVPVSCLESLLDAGREFDIIHMCDVLPHLPDPAATLRKLEELLAPGGLFLIDGPLEKNPSLVYYVAAATKAIRRRLGCDSTATLAPTMLVRLDRDAQRAFFTCRLGYQEHDFEVYETGWPYYVAGRPIGSAATCAKQAVGRLAIAVSRLQRTKAGRLGNRFVGLYLPRANA